MPEWDIIGAANGTASWHLVELHSSNNGPNHSADVN